jgi:hypothetical protein
VGNLPTYIHTYIHACTHTCMHTHIHAYIHIGRLALPSEYTMSPRCMTSVRSLERLTSLSTCMYVCMCVCMYVCMYVYCMYVNMPHLQHSQVRPSTHAYPDQNIHTHTYIRTYIRTYIHTCTHTYRIRNDLRCTLGHMHIYQLHSHTHIHTYIHTAFATISGAPLDTCISWSCPIPDTPESPNMINRTFLSGPGRGGATKECSSLIMIPVVGVCMYVCIYIYVSMC